MITSEQARILASSSHASSGDSPVPVRYERVNSVSNIGNNIFCGL